jgi:hypothetical protein
MAERHTIVVRVIEGKAAEVQFCDCCQSVTVEIRIYTDSIQAKALARPVWYMDGGTIEHSQYKRDEFGVYESSYHEPEYDDE